MTATPLSRPAHPHPSTVAVQRQLSVHPLLWLALCMSTSGCFYLRPIREPMPNEPPVILEPETLPATKTVRTNAFTLVVIASDPEGSAVSFEWPDLVDVDHETTRFADGELWIGTARIHDATTLTTSSIRALVHDGDRDNLVTVRWDLVFP